MLSWYFHVEDLLFPDLVLYPNLSAILHSEDPTGWVRHRTIRDRMNGRGNVTRKEIPRCQAHGNQDLLFCRRSLSPAPVGGSKTTLCRITNIHVRGRRIL